MYFFVDIYTSFLMSVGTGIEVLSKTVSLDAISCQEVSVRSISVSVFGVKGNNQRSVIAKISRLLWIDVCRDKCWGFAHIMQGGVMWQC